MSSDIIQNEVDNLSEKRETWSGKFDFVLSALGYAGIITIQTLAY